MRATICVIFLTAFSCRSAEVRKPLTLLKPYEIRLGEKLPAITGKLSLDTTQFALVGLPKIFKRYTISVDELRELELRDNLYDSIQFDFFNDELLGMTFFLSGNQKIEILKFGLNPNERYLSGEFYFRGKSLIARDSTFRMGGYRQLNYTFRKGAMTYDYREDIVDNVAYLNIINAKVVKKTPGIHGRR